MLLLLLLWKMTMLLLLLLPVMTRVTALESMKTWRQPLLTAITRPWWQLAPLSRQLSLASLHMTVEAVPLPVNAALAAG